MRVLAVALAVLLWGCATRPEVRYVSAETPTVSVPAEPAWATDRITDETPPGEVAKLWIAFRLQCLGYVNELQTLLGNYAEAGLHQQQKETENTHGDHDSQARSRANHPD